MARVNHFEMMADYGKLNGKVLRKKPLGARRMRGLGFFGVAALGYWNLTALSLMLGSSTMPLLAIAFATVNGMHAFNESEKIQWIEAITEGEHAGKMRLKIMSSPFFGRTLLTDTFETHTLVNCGSDSMGAGRTGSNIMRLIKYTEESTGEVKYDGAFIVPEDAWRDVRFMEWINGQKNPKSQTLVTFHDVVVRRHLASREKGVYFTGIKAFTARQTGFANVKSDSNIDEQIEKGDHKTDKVLRKMVDELG